MMNFGDAVLAAWNSAKHEEESVKTSYEELYEGAFLPRPGTYKPLYISMLYEKWAEEMNRQGYFFNHSMPSSEKIGKKWTGKVAWYSHNMRLSLHGSFDEISITRNIGGECVKEIWCHGEPAVPENLAGRNYFAFPVQYGGLKIWHRKERCFSEHATMAEAVEALGICAECECLRRRFGCLSDEAGEPLRGEDGERIECIEGFYCRHQCAIREAACRSR